MRAARIVSSTSSEIHVPLIILHSKKASDEICTVRLLLSPGRCNICNRTFTKQAYYQAHLKGQAKRQRLAEQAGLFPLTLENSKSFGFATRAEVFQSIAHDHDVLAKRAVSLPASGALSASLHADRDADNERALKRHRPNEHAQ